jgi:tetratricopeptide (TPR) repeat protein
MKCALFFPLLIIAVFVLPTFANAPDPKIITDANRCVELVFQEKFSDAHSVAGGIIRQFPNSPAGYFLRGAIYHYQMLYLRKNIYDKQLYESCNKGMEIGEQNKGKNDGWNDFFLAATIGVQGSYERVNGRLVSALKLSSRAIEIFRTMDEASVKDVLYGVGVYDYWIGANAKLLWWMPGVKDNRVGALKDLERMRKEGLFTKLIVNYDLMEMYLNEKRYQDVINVANGILAKYPSNSIALWALYDAYDSMKNEAEREVAAAKIIANIEREKDNDQQLRFFNRKTKRN